VSELVRKRLDPPLGGWPAPWPQAFELSAALDPDLWTLVGGLMVQAHSYAHRLGAIRPTQDVDVLVQVLVPGSIADVESAIQELGYHLQPPHDRKDGFAYRFLRDDGSQVDVIGPDHPPQHVAMQLRQFRMMEADGGAQAHLRSMRYEVVAANGQVVEFPIPDELGALIMKSAAAQASPATNARHLRDAAVLAAMIDDPLAARSTLRGSDGKRLRYIATELANSTHVAWRGLPDVLREQGLDALRVLAAKAPVIVATRSTRLA
jgi:hypothetical protein